LAELVAVDTKGQWTDETLAWALEYLETYERSCRMSAVLILMVVAIVCWFLAAIPLPWANPVQLGWLGMFFAGLSFVIK
jgi:hypothetical protein